jgi:uncharacterized membrane protein YagU involved in acid resistance
VDLGPTLSGLQIVGLVHLFYLRTILREVQSTQAGRSLLYGLALLAVLVLVYGYVLPWPDKTGERLWTQRSEGRSVINFGATITHISAALYVAACFQIREYRQRMVNYLLIGTTLASIGTILEVVTRIDLFSILAPNRRDWVLGEGGRARGFNAEPRASGSLSASGIVMLLGPAIRPNARMGILLLIHALGVAFTTSTLALVMLVVGVIAMLVFTRRVAIVLVAAAFSSLTIIALGAWFGDSPLELWVQYTGERFATREAAVDSRTFGDMLVQSLEVFDASAIGFLFSHPEHTLVGVGPGLISIPASDYVPAGAAYAIFGDRIDSIPFMGLIRNLSDSGILGLLLWFWNVAVVAEVLRKCARANPDDLSWAQFHACFLVFTLLYLLQTRPSWYLWLGVGLGAAVTLRRVDVQALLAAKAKSARPSHRPRSVIPLRPGV